MDNKSKKKLLIAVHKLDYGGVQKSLLSVLRVLNYNTYEVTLYVRKARCDLLEKVDGRVSKIMINDDKTHYYRKPRAVLLYAALRVLQLFHMNSNKTQERLNRYIAERKMRYEKERFFSDGTEYDIAVSYIHGATAQFVEKYVPAKKKIVFFHVSTDDRHSLHEEIFPLYDKIVAVNAGCRDILRELYPDVSDRIEYLENYVDADDVRKAASAYSVDRAGNQLVLCTCGRMTGEKGFDLAVKAAAMLKGQKSDFIWYFVGDGPEREALVSAVKREKLEEQIRFTGILDNPYPYMAACDIYVQPSYEEAHSLSMLEAQILRKPIVSTATTGGKEIIRDGETGVLAEITAESLANNIYELQKDDVKRFKIIENLGKINWRTDAERFRKAWAVLLEDDPAI